MPSERFGDLRLRQPRIPSGGTKPFEHILILDGVNRAWTTLSVPHAQGARCFLFRDNPKWVIIKTDRGLRQRGRLSTVVERRAATAMQVLMREAVRLLPIGIG